MTPEEIKKTRIALGRTQEELAQLLGTTASTVGRWERGDNAPLPLFRKHLEKLSDYVEKHNPSKEPKQ